MTIVGAVVVLGLVVAVLIKWKIVRPVAAAVCILFGLVLGASPVGDRVNVVLIQIGQWLSTQVGAL